MKSKGEPKSHHCESSLLITHCTIYFLINLKLYHMTFEEAQAMYELYCIDPSLTCTCDEVHICQQCMEEE